MTNPQITSINSHPHPEPLFTIFDLSSTAERKERHFKDGQGRTRIIKARPAKKGMLPMGESTIWEKVRRGEFPKPIKISTRITCWRKSDIIKWLESKQ